MDKQAQRKALFRSKLRESSQNRSTRIDSPLVRYNESDQPVCRVCNVVLKSETIWPVHLASRKHLEAVENIKAAAAGVAQACNISTVKSAELHKTRPSSSLPAEFFDNKEPKKRKSGHVLEANENNSSIKLEEPSKNTDYADSKLNQAPNKSGTVEAKRVKGALPDGFFDSTEISESMSINRFGEASKKFDGSDTKQVSGGALPEGFFDNKDADLRARGIEPIKVDINDAYKEFEKEIYDDLQGVDDRLEEEEIDAAEIWEEQESLELQAFREQVEMVKKQLLNVKAARVAEGKKSPKFKGKESSDESSSDDDDDNDFAVDWRAMHL